MKKTEPHKESICGTIALMEHMQTKGEALGLSPRETEILSLLAFGFVQKQIAADLKISPHTVNSYLRKIFLKLNVHNSAHAVGKLTLARPT